MYLKGVGIVYPDFTFLSRKTKQEIYWEHDGRMADPSYVRNAVRKMHANEKNDIYPGERRRDMEKNDFEMDTLKERKRDFFKGIRGWMSLGIFLTGLLTFGGAIGTTRQVILTGIEKHQMAASGTEYCIS